MRSKQETSSSIDAYIAAFPPDVGALLQKLRETIRRAAPEAQETISYQIPTFALNGNLVHFAAFKSHIGFYPGASGIKHFENELSGYVGGKGSVRFPFDAPMPLALVARIVKFRVAESLAKPPRRRRR